MSMSTHVYAIVPPDDKWQQMKIIYDACTAAKVEVPAEVWKFFGQEVPDPKGVLVNLDRNAHYSCTEYQDEYSQGFEVDISKLDPKYRILRFTNSW